MSNFVLENRRRAPFLKKARPHMRIVPPMFLPCSSQVPPIFLRTRIGNEGNEHKSNEEGTSALGLLKIFQNQRDRYIDLWEVPSYIIRLLSHISSLSSPNVELNFNICRGLNENFCERYFYVNVRKFIRELDVNTPFLSTWHLTARALS